VLLSAGNIGETGAMASNSQDYVRKDCDIMETELSAHSHCNGLFMTQSNADSGSTSRHETAHDWEGYKTMDKDFYDDGTITFFWWV